MTEQIAALKEKREEDRVRLQEHERTKIQLAQLEENRRLMQEQSAELQRNLAQAKSVSCFVCLGEPFDAFGGVRRRMLHLLPLSLDSRHQFNIGGGSRFEFHQLPFRRVSLLVSSSF